MTEGHMTMGTDMGVTKLGTEEVLEMFHNKELFSKLKNFYKSKPFAFLLKAIFS